MKKRFGLLVAPLALGVMSMALPFAGTTAFANTTSQGTPVAKGVTDLGATNQDAHITATIYFKVQNQNQLKQYIQSTVTPGNSNYHKFLSVDEFASQYAPSNSDIAQVQNYFQKYGIKVSAVYADHLVMQVVGTVAQFNNAFHTVIHDYSKNGVHYHAPRTTPVIPDTLIGSVLAVAGLNTASAAQPMSMSSSQQTDTSAPAVVLPKNGATATGVPGDLTVGDTANLYDINPLYQQGITGKGQTIGIATLANFNPQDAYAYWNAIGLNVAQNRITQVHVDGGGGSNGSDETTLDVEQSGGLAPDANIIVYDAPNTDSGFLDVFYQAVSDNKVDTLSVSWGQPEIDYVAGMNQGVDYTNELTAFDQAFMEGAAQGISMFAASGDSGAYDTNRAFPDTYGFSTPLSVDAPASDPYITAAGGTTLPDVTVQTKHGAQPGSPVVNTGTTERPWAWDYFTNYLNYWYGPNGKAFQDPNPVVDLGYFSVGDGGGVSTIWARPWYQQGVAGMQNTEADQTFTDSNGYLYGTPFSYDLPSNFAGRNVADLSMDADPYTGYLVYFNGGFQPRWGGTSFVAPQLNGITSLIDQDAGGRVGLLNPTLYSFMQSNGYGQNAPFNALTQGDNWGYQANGGYSPAAGIGTPNVANLAAAIAAQSQH